MTKGMQYTGAVALVAATKPRHLSPGGHVDANTAPRPAPMSTPARVASIAMDQWAKTRSLSTLRECHSAMSRKFG
eukprot:CAMPEP_0185162962 /NCGR_PEP_ID=MMETSP1139-20130426/7300_1 /TAXON_ID=298111 /ORGANISM="Pavlova sp., Strain CCMP459" /LENGTH=74 /DNA_ID=CAMNT_0027728307 /DNA_START=352 /DNA_END=573 /DNA_ORIENTATION=+